MERTLQDVRTTCELAILLHPENINKAVRHCAKMILAHGGSTVHTAQALHKIKNARNPTARMYSLTARDTT